MLSLELRDLTRQFSWRARFLRPYEAPQLPLVLHAAAWRAISLAATHPEPTTAAIVPIASTQAAVSFQMESLPFIVQLTSAWRLSFSVYKSVWIAVIH